MADLYDDGAWLYDAAFSWDVEDEADWLVERLGPGTRRVLEPACGSGRMFPALTRRELELTGLDRSEAMLERARARMRCASLPPPRLVRADMSDFDLGGIYDAALCPINTFGYLLEADQARNHLACVARHLSKEGRYLLQVDLHAWDEQDGGSCSWEEEDPGGRGRVRCVWKGGRVDPATERMEERTEFEVLTGPEAGRTWTFESEMRAWSWPGWRDLIEASPFVQVAAWDGSDAHRGALDVGPGLERERLTWHELVVFPWPREGSCA